MDILIASHLTQQILVSFQNGRRCRLHICQRTNWATFQLRRTMWLLTRKHAFFGQVTEEGSLKLLVELVNETIFHKVKVPREGTLARARPPGKLATLSTT